MRYFCHEQQSVVCVVCTRRCSLLIMGTDDLSPLVVVLAGIRVLRGTRVIVLSLRPLLTSALLGGKVLI